MPSTVKKRTALRLVVAAAAIAWVAWVSFGGKPGANSAGQGTAIPADAQAFTLGKLEFHACELPQKRSGATTRAWCAPFSVPEDPARPNGRRLNLRLALIRSDAPAADRDIVVYLAGGPGQSAVDSWPQMAAALSPLRKHHHILLLDQRGTGGSNPLTCKGDGSKGLLGGVPGLEKIREQTRECLHEVEAVSDPRYYTTTAAVARSGSGAPGLGGAAFRPGRRLLRNAGGPAVPDALSPSRAQRRARQRDAEPAGARRGLCAESRIRPEGTVLGVHAHARLRAGLWRPLRQPGRTA